MGKRRHFPLPAKEKWINNEVCKSLSEKAVIDISGKFP